MVNFLRVLRNERSVGFFLSLRMRILLLILASSLLSMGAVLWVLLVLRADTIERSNDQLVSQIEMIASDLDNRVSGTAQLLFGLARVPVVGSQDKEECSNFLADVLQEHPQYTGLLTIWPNGQLHCDSLKTGRRLNLSDRAYFQRALHSKRYVVEPVLGRLTGKGVLQIAYPVRDAAGSLQYVLLASLNLDDFGRTVASSLPYEHMNFQIWSDDGSIVMDHPAVGASKLMPGPSEKAFVLSDAPGKIVTLGQAEDARIWTKVALPRVVGASVRLAFSVLQADLVEREDIRLRLVKRIFACLLLSTAVLFVVAIFLGEFALRRQAVRLVRAITRVDQGNFNQPIGAPYPKGELGEMMLAVDRMALSLELQREVIQRNTEALQRQAYTDALTGLANRNLFNDRMEQAVIYAHRAQRVAAVIILDLDRFKTINDTLGHNQGDALLQTVAQRLQSCVREGDTVARWGGDEFVVVLADMAHDSDILAVAQEILHTLAQPIVLQGQTLTGCASMGVSVYPRDGKSVEELLRHADAAMYRAKEQGGNSMVFFTAEMSESIADRMHMEAGLRRAVEHNELRLHFQPIVQLATGYVVSAEALLRWHDPERGVVSAAQFIRIAEETGLIIPIGRWVLQQACQQAKTWQEQGLGSIPVAVNLSARQFNAPLLEATIAQALASTQCPADLLHLEITESMLIANVEQALQTMQRISDMGVQLSIDDFGTGYSSLNYLRRFPVAKLKMDRSFVRDIHVDANGTVIVDAILTLAQKMGLRTVAEGVQTVEHFAFLQARGCDECQGYYIATPLDADEFVRFVRLQLERIS